MKLFKKIFPVVLCAFCFTISATGCQTQCGGIVKGFEIKEEYFEIREESILFGIVESGYYPQLTVTFNQDFITTEHCYCSEITIYVSDFEKYGETTLEDLLCNDEFLNMLQEEHRINSTTIEGTTSGAITYFGGTDNLAYLLYYEFYEEYTETPIIENPSNYAGYVKIN